MVLPFEFHALFDWMEANGFLMPSEAYPGDRLGLLGTEDDVQSDRVTAILFRVATGEQARSNGRDWFGEIVPNIEERLVPFARTGGDGSCAAFWLDDEGCQQIVHLGSEGLVCRLGRTPLDFLRLLAIGYEEISGDGLGAPGEPPRDTLRNEAYRAWLAERFAVPVPRTAAEILGEVPDALAETSSDPFWRWVREQQDGAA
ncbi:hypothetical protein Q8W71_07190 [Methylobacterium sp. NEAU 140]|nr:hypothetical protein [Methylobacterium sp. NEAU 140]